MTDGSALLVALGWAGGAFFALRMVWGIVSRADARFAAFSPVLFKAPAHLRDVLRSIPREHASHNPAGAMMIYALWLWLSLAVAIGTGLVMSKGATPWDIAARQAIVENGDWSQLATDKNGAESEDAGEDSPINQIHEVCANPMLIMAVIRVARVGIESRLLRSNLVKPMITGRP